jgi:hypothetical protein
MGMQEALDILNIKPDFDAPVVDSLLYIHRRTANEEIYFVSNQSNSSIAVAPHFKVEGKKPELWDPLTGNIRQLPQYTNDGSTATVPLKLAPLQSAFVVFRNTEAKATEGKINFPEAVKILEIANSWQVQFDAKMRGGEQPVIFDKLTDWTLRPEESIKYYSGTAVYRNKFNLAKPAALERIFLHLGDVKVMAKVKVNGKAVGGVWTAPWQLDITDALKVGANTVEISVVNTWVNRLIGDSKLPAGQRTTWTSVNPYRPDSTLEPSGLKGPVCIYSIKY